ELADQHCRRQAGHGKPEVTGVNARHDRAQGKNEKTHDRSRHRIEQASRHADAIVRRSGGHGGTTRARRGNLVLHENRYSVRERRIMPKRSISSVSSSSSRRSPGRNLKLAHTMPPSSGSSNSRGPTATRRSGSE